MKLSSFSLAILLVAAPLALLAPAASAKPYCTWSERDCQDADALVCWTPADACVENPCRVERCLVGPQAAVDKCVNYAYVADYHWYYVCVDPQGGACAVYFKERHGVTETTSCPLDKAAVTAAAPEPWCVPTSGSLDYPSYLCVDASNPRCAVYHETTSDWGARRTCVPPQVSTSGGLNPLADHDGDGDMEVGPACVWGSEDACVVPAYECFQPYRPAFGITCI